MLFQNMKKKRQEGRRNTEGGRVKSMDIVLELYLEICEIFSLCKYRKVEETTAGIASLTQSQVLVGFPTIILLLCQDAIQVTTVISFVCLFLAKIGL